MLSTYVICATECIKVSSTYRHFTAIAQLSSKLADTLVMTEELLDTALAKQCTNFQSTTYAKLQVSYRYSIINPLNKRKE